ncbi:MAG: phage holin family protein [Clostridia bacterium]|nr:phage holin family protein [Clostridia bacterium]
MKNVLETITLGFGGIGGVLGLLFGELDGSLYALVVFVIADYFTGVISAISNKKLSSDIGFEGISKKICIFVLVAIANIVDVDILNSGAAVRTAVIFFYLSNEGISVLENAVKLGLPVPEKLRNVLLKMNEGDSDDDKNIIQ